MARALVCAMLLSTASMALAETPVVVLGVRSVEGDDEFANTLTNELREAAKSVDGWQVSNSSVSMSQMSLAHGCDEIDASCLSDIAGGLSTSGIIYGTVRRTSTKSDHDYSLTLSHFHAQSGSIEETITIIIPRADAEGTGLSDRAADAVAQVSGTKTEAGMISVQVNVNDAQVSLNGQPVGETSEGHMALENVQPGAYELEVSAEGHRSYKARITVRAGAEANVLVTLHEGEGTDLGPDPAEAMDQAYELDTDSGGGVPKWVGYSLLGVSGASLIGMGVSWIVISGVENDTLYKEYQGIVHEGNMSAAPGDQESDVCEAAKNGRNYNMISDAEVTEVHDMCNRAGTFEVLQWVFLGTAVVAGGLGAYFLLTYEEPTATAQLGEGRKLTLKPSVGVRSAHLRATLTF